MIPQLNSVSSRISDNSGSFPRFPTTTQPRSIISLLQVPKGQTLDPADEDLQNNYTLQWCTAKESETMFCQLIIWDSGLWSDGGGSSGSNKPPWIRHSSLCARSCVCLCFCLSVLRRSAFSSTDWLTDCVRFCDSLDTTNRSFRRRSSENFVNFGGRVSFEICQLTHWHRDVLKRIELVFASVPLGPDLLYPVLCEMQIYIHLYSPVGRSIHNIERNNISTNKTGTSLCRWTVKNFATARGPKQQLSA